jgi:hypothetical protein
VPDSPAPFKRLTSNELCGPPNGRPANNIGLPAKSSERKLGATFFLQWKAQFKTAADSDNDHSPWAGHDEVPRGNQQFDRLR